MLRPVKQTSAGHLRILLGQLGANGDCLCATAIARQIKHDFPGCRLTWAVGSRYRAVLEENPFIDEIWEYPLASLSELADAWEEFAREARRRKRAGDFDEIFLTQVPPDNYRNFDGTVRASIFRGYPRPITVPITPVLRLSDAEVHNAERFVTDHGIDTYSHRILFECAGASGQTFLTPGFAEETARLVLERVPDTAVILSSNIPVHSSDRRIIDASVLPLRQNAHLTRHCTLFVGGCSGITWLAMSDWARPLPMLQLLSRRTSVFASVVHDAEYFGLPAGHVLEMTDCPPGHAAECIIAVLTGEFSSARARFHERIPVRLDFYLTVFIWSLMKRGRLLTVARSLLTAFRRYGPGPFFTFGLERMTGYRPSGRNDGEGAVP